MAALSFGALHGVFGVLHGGVQVGGASAKKTLIYSSSPRIGLSRQVVKRLLAKRRSSALI